MFVTAALTRGDVANYVGALFEVYGVLILIYVLSTMLFSFGMRPGYSRALDAVLSFLRDVSEPWLRIFRRFIPAIGPLDLSPLVALVALGFIGGLITQLIRG